MSTCSTFLYLNGELEAEGIDCAFRTKQACHHCGHGLLRQSDLGTAFVTLGSERNFAADDTKVS